MILQALYRLLEKRAALNIVFLNRGNLLLVGGGEYVRLLHWMDGKSTHMCNRVPGYGDRSSTLDVDQPDESALVDSGLGCTEQAHREST